MREIASLDTLLFIYRVNVRPVRHVYTVRHIGPIRHVRRVRPVRRVHTVRLVYIALTLVCHRIQCNSATWLSMDICEHLW